MERYRSMCIRSRDPVNTAPALPPDTEPNRTRSIASEAAEDTERLGWLGGKPKPLKCRPREAPTAGVAPPRRRSRTPGQGANAPAKKAGMSNRWREGRREEQGWIGGDEESLPPFLSFDSSWPEWIRFVNDLGEATVRARECDRALAQAVREELPGPGG